VIGTFTPTAVGYTGQISTLTVRRRVRILASEKPKGDHAPDFKILCSEADIGAAWKATSKTGQAYLAVQIDDPAWPQSIRACLFENDGVATLCWNRK
jgi:uncharacterized protein (DUF736 family)